MDSMEYDIMVIGAGAAGLMASVKAAESGRGLRVCLLEKMPSCGRKIRITGKGRCNLTNTRPWNEFSEKVHPKASFFRPAFFHFSNEMTMSFFEESGLPLVVERGDRVYPSSMRAEDVVNTLQQRAEKSGVILRTSFAVSSVSHSSDTGFVVEAESFGENYTFHARAVIVATGGMSYPLTGSTGDGYAFAESLGHRITPLFPALTALVPENYVPFSEPFTLKNVNLSLYDSDILLQSEFGDMDFTDGGIEGPLGFKVSRKAVKAMENGGKVRLVVDMKPAVSEEVLARRIRSEVEEGRYTEKTLMRNILKGFMPHAVLDLFLSSNKGLSLGTLPHALKNWEFKIKDYVGYRRAVVTAGGVDISQIRQKDLSSKLVPGLYFAGEVMDLDADTGGYNLQIAFSTGALAGEAAAKFVASGCVNK